MTNIVKKIIIEQLLFENKLQKVTDYWINSLEKSGKNLKYRYSDDSIKTVVDYVSTQDPSGNNKYLEWLTRQIFNNQISMFSDLLYKSVSQYHKNLNRITPDFLEKLKNLENIGLSYANDEDKILKNPKDINSFSNLDSLKFFNEVLLGFKTKKELKQLDDDAKKVIKLYQSPYVEVVVPLSVEASCRYGAGTKWCTSARVDNAYLHYSKESFLVYVLPKKSKIKQSKIAFLIPRDQVDMGTGFVFQAFDETDMKLPSRLSMNDILTMYVKDENNNVLTRECQDIETEISDWYWRQ